MIPPGARRLSIGAFVVLATAIAHPSTAWRQTRGVTVSDALTGRRSALVIGNNAYPEMPLKNAVADARAIAAALTRYGFEVDLAMDLSLRDLNRRIDRFVSQLRLGDVAMVYFAGHGIQLEAENYLVPIDFHARDPADAKYEAYSASRLVDRVTASGARLSIVVLDACRNNPFRATRSAANGLAAMETGEGTLVAFATAPNRTADDNPSGSNGLFTTYLLEAMDDPSLSVEQVFSHARQKVYEASKHRQIPWLVSSVIGEFHFRAPAAPPGAPTSTPGSRPPPAATPPATRAAADPRVFAAGSSALEFYQIKADRTHDFESVMLRVKDALARSSNDARRQQAASWRVYRAAESMAGGNTMFLFVIDPAVPGISYSEPQILAEGLPSEAQALYGTYAAAIAGTHNIVPMHLVSAMAPPDRAPGAAALSSNAKSRAPATAGRTFSGDVGLVLNFIKGDRTADFERILRRLRQGFAESASAERRAQAAGWKVYRTDDPAPSGEVIYVYLMDPAVKGAEYSVSGLLGEAFPNEAQALLKDYVEAYSSRGMTWVNLTLVADFSR